MWKRRLLVMGNNFLFETLPLEGIDYHADGSGVSTELDSDSSAAFAKAGHKRFLGYSHLEQVFIYRHQCYVSNQAPDAPLMCRG